MRKETLCLFLAVSLGFGSLQAANTFFVWRDNPSPQSPYDSWETAATELQAAADLADDGDTILVTNGVYNTGGIPAPGYILTNRLYINKQVDIRSVAPTRTGAVIVGAAADGGSFGTNAVRGVFLDGGASISGFTITGGFTHTNNSVYQDAAGGGIFMGSGTVVSNCLVATNSAAYHGGGAVFNQPDHALIIDSEFEFNRSEGMGGGVYCHEGWGVVDDCIIHDNYAHNKDSGGGGGGVASRTGSNSSTKCVDVLNSFIYNNTTTGVGGGIYTYRGDSVIESCVVSNNTGGTGGIYFWIGNKGVVKDCLITHNTGSNSSTGVGGIYMYSSGTIENCVIVDNTSKFSGGFFARGGTMRNCLIARNTSAKSGGAVYFVGTATTIINSTIVNNTTTLAGGADGIFFDKINGTLRNCIVWGNGTNNYAYSDSPNVTYTCISPAFVGEGNIDADPRFISTNKFNYTLSGISPAIDAGLNEPWMDTSTDLSGGPRIHKDVVDMGAYEYVRVGSMVLVR